MSYKRISPIAVNEGGTGAQTLTGVLTGNGTSAFTASAVTQHDVLVGGASNAITSVAPSSTSGVPLISQGASADPVFGTAVVAGGGTGATSFTAYAPICGGTSTTGLLQSASTGISTSGFILTSTGASSLPTFQAPAASSISITGNSGGALTGNAFTFTGGTTGLTFAGAGTTETLGGTLVVSNGGTGAATFTANGVIYGNTTSALQVTAAGTNGQVLLGATSAAPAFATLTSTGGTITYTTGTNSLNLDVVGGGVPWTVVTGTTQSAAVNNGYIANNAGTVTVTLPSTAAVGSIFKVTGINNATGWKLAVASGQTIYFGTSATTTSTGSLQSTSTRDAVEIVCVVANTDFNVLYSIGNITVV